jgi:hypothetical protein
VPDAEHVVQLAQIGELASGAQVRIHALLREWELGTEAGHGVLADESGTCPLLLDLRGRPELRPVARELLDGFVLALRAVVRKGAVELLRPEDLLGTEVFLRPEHDLRRFAGRRVTLSGGVARIGWLPGRGAGLLMLSDGGTGAWVHYRYLDEPQLLRFAQQIELVGFAAVRGTVVRIAVTEDEPVYPPRFALFRGLPADVELYAVEPRCAEDILLAEPSAPAPRHATNCALGQSLGCQTLCCTRQVRLGPEHLQQGLLSTELPGGIHYLRREEDGYCYALDRSTGRCGVYEIRPQICRDFSCVHEPSILERMRRQGPIEHLPLFARLDP